MVQLGMDVDVVRDVASRIDAQSHCLDGIVGAVDSLSTSAVAAWQGHDASDFHDHWHHTHRRGLSALVDALAQLAAALRRNVAEQEHASNGNSASSTPAPSAGATPAPAPAAPNPAGTLPPSGAAAYHHAMHVGASGYDQWGKAPDNCTSWAAFRRSELGLSIPPGNGFEMGHDANLPPSLGALASTGPTATNQYGHVMVVEQVMSPDKFRVSEMNVDGHGSFRDTQTWDRQPDGTWRSELTGKVDVIKFTP